MTITKEQTYMILELNQGDSELEIKKAYRKLSLQHHPEKNGNSEEKEVEELQKEAKENLDWSISFVFSSEEAQKELTSFTESERERYFKELQEIRERGDGEIGKIAIFRQNLFKAESRKMLSEKIKDSYDSKLLTDIINIAVIMCSDDAPLYQGEENY
ncbi:28418_t:CDS:2 [Racocetra persica]|uniref:28418_t:CDS:1 n=1 Tax=Racocetra persica TaxID=160502 RepID=A0ACA9NGC2_9GLOM|nr:28418_t:CDS:2 [Racocetra persica]